MDKQLRSAGQDPEQQRLEKLAHDDPRIVFLGYRRDAELIADYENALAVLFVPQAED